MQDHFGPARDALALAPFRAGALVRTTDGATLLECDPDAVFPAASVIKVPLLMTLQADAAEGRIDVERQVPVGERVDGSGILRDLRDVSTISLRDLAALTIGLSDNTATNRLIEAVGLDRVAARLDEWGMRTTALRRRMYDFDAAKRGLENVTTPREMVTLLERLIAGGCGGRAASDAVLALMERCQDDTKLRRYLAPDAMVPSKSGTLDHSRNDVAVFRGPAGVVCAAVFTREVDDHLGAEHVIGLIGRGAALAAGMSVPALPFAAAGD